MQNGKLAQGEDPTLWSFMTLPAELLRHQKRTNVLPTPGMLEFVAD